MKSKSILYILITLIVLSVSIGIVSASEDIDSTYDFLSIEQDEIIIEEEISEVTFETTYDDEVTNNISLNEMANDISL